MYVIWDAQRPAGEQGHILTYNYPAPDVIEVTLDGASDTFDFSALPDGAEATEIQSTLDPCPVLSAKRVNGRLEVVLLKFHGPNAPESERFPAPEEVSF